MAAPLCPLCSLSLSLSLCCQIEDVVAKLSSELKQHEKDADEFRIKYNIQMGDAQQQQQQQQQQQAQGERQGGVLA